MDLRSDSQATLAVTESGLPRISYNLQEHKKGIIIAWSMLLLSSGALPIILYFTLRYCTSLKLTYVLAVTTGVFGAFTLFSLSMRTYQLAKKKSTCRPLGASRWSFDYFHWNFLFGFVVVTIIIVVGNVLLNVRTVAFGSSFIIVQVTTQCLFIGTFHSLGWRVPFRVSSVAAHEPARSGVYLLAEDIVGVDGGQGQTFRRELATRYEASLTVRKLCWRLDMMWGISGIIVGGGIIALIYAVPDENVAYVLGWSLPWAYAGIMAIITLIVCKSMLRNEVADGMSEKDKQGNLSE